MPRTITEPGWPSRARGSLSSPGVAVRRSRSRPGAGAERRSRRRSTSSAPGRSPGARWRCSRSRRPGATRIAVLKQFRPDFRPQYVLALDAVRTKAGKPTWYRISIPGRPNGRTGWVRAASLELHPVHKRARSSIAARGGSSSGTATRLVRSGKVAVGAPGAETPLGLFYVTDKFDPAIDPDWAILGAYAFETSAYSKLTDWPGGGIVGVHGTPWPNLLGQAVSHGCIRLRNDDVEFLRNRVPLGTPVKIVR